jgi:sugar/nucleoside kinase (ribokinase family)
VILCGTCVADILVRPVPLTVAPGAGKLFHVDPIRVTTGGIVCNTGTAMARLGMKVAASSLVGTDVWGEVIRSTLAGEGIATEALEASGSVATSTTAVLIDPSGERSFAHHGGAPATIDLAFIRRQIPHFAAARLTLVGYLGLLPGLEADLTEALAEIHATGCMVALETAGSGGTLAQVAPALPLVDVYVPSLDEARHQTGLDDPREIVDCYRSHGAPGDRRIAGQVTRPPTHLPQVVGDVPICVPHPGRPVGEPLAVGPAHVATGSGQRGPGLVALQGPAGADSGDQPIE